MSLTDFDLHADDKHLKYRSKKKMDGFLEKKRKRRVVSVSLATGGIGTTFENRSDREVLTAIGKRLVERELVSYEIDANPGKYILVRAACTAGTMWPFAGNQERYSNLVYWIGASAHYRVFAYGSRSNLLDGSATMPPGDSPTWYPSELGNFHELLDSVATSVAEERPLQHAVDRSKKVEGLIDFCFQGNVQRGVALANRGIFEFLLRVDGLESPENRGKEILYGSPIWVAQSFNPVAGVYAITAQAPAGVSAVADWDPEGGWSNARWRHHGVFQKPKQRPLTQVPELPLDPPKAADVLELHSY